MFKRHYHIENIAKIVRSPQKRMFLKQVYQVFIKVRGMQKLIFLYGSIVLVELYKTVYIKNVINNVFEIKFIENYVKHIQKIRTFYSSL